VTSGTCCGLGGGRGGRSVFVDNDGKIKGKGHPCTGTEALCRPYGP
jgi:hypothetical protein